MTKKNEYALDEVDISPGIFEQFAMLIQHAEKRSEDFLLEHNYISGTEIKLLDNGDGTAELYCIIKQVRLSTNLKEGEWSVQEIPPS